MHVAGFNFFSSIHLFKTSKTNYIPVNTGMIQKPITNEIIISSRIPEKSIFMNFHNKKI
jgi:hypothetical protein